MAVNREGSNHMSNEYKEENKANEKSLNMMDLDENLRKMIAQTIEQSVKLAVEDTVAVFSERINELENKLEQANEKLKKQEIEETEEDSVEFDVAEETIEDETDIEITMEEETVAEKSVVEELTAVIEETTAEEPKPASNEKLGDDAIAALFEQMNAGAETEAVLETEAEPNTRRRCSARRSNSRS